VIDIYEEALCLRPEGHVRRAESLNDLGYALYHFCLNHEADETRRNRCIELLREGLRLRPPGNPLRDISLHNLSKALRFALSQHQDDLERLVECASLNREALQLRPSGHPERGMSLNGLAVDLMRMVQHTGDMERLPEIVSMYREALQMHLSGHPMRHISLNNLATALCMSFKHSARSEHIAEAISVYREAVQLRPRGHPMRHTALQGLAYALTLRSVDEGHPESLSEAIQLQRECLELLPDSHSHRSMNMGNLADSLLASFRSSGDANTLAEAISLSREAVTLYSPMDYIHDNVLNTLAEVLEAKLDKDSDIETLTEVADLYREVLRRRPIGHYRRYWSLEGLARVLCKSGSSLWPEALTCYQEALQICPMEGPERSRVWSGMSACFLDTNSPLFSLSEGVACLSKAYAHSFLHVNERLKSAISALEHLETACRTSTQCAHSEAGTPDDERILELYAQVIGLLPLAANFGLDHGARLQAVAGTDDIARSAVTRALLLGNLSQAIEMMELGRGVFWMQTLHLHTTAFDVVPKDDCQELQQMLRMLEHAARRADIRDQSAVRYEQELERRRKLNDAVQAMITRIRGYPGLDRFLLPPVFDVLLGSLPDGFVVIVNTSKLSNHALLLHRATGLKTSLPLQPFPTGFDCAKLRAQLPRDGVSASGKEGEIETRAMRLDNGRVGNLEDVLPLLWTSIALPVLEGLSLNVSAAIVHTSRFF
jgi:tetratricopeptide (TPR) repeat protein